VKVSSDNYPRVTIAIPTFNRAGSFFPQTLASARSQSYTNLDIVIADNCSPDETRTQVEALRDPRIRYYRHSSNIGQSANESFCLQMAEGEYLIVLPDDDLIDQDFVESCVKLAVRDPNAGVVRTGTRLINAQDQIIGELSNQAAGLPFDDFVRAWIDGDTSPYQCSSMFRTAALLGVGLHSRHHLLNDAFSHFKIAAGYGRIDIKEIKATFRVHDESATDKADIRAWCEESVDLLDLLCELSPRNREFIRTRGVKFLATGNYRRALRKPFPRDMVAVLTVFRMLRFAPPPWWVLKEAVGKRWRQFLARNG
jgi:glycosyltransferase involved in cell wall biosynthesis